MSHSLGFQTDPAAYLSHIDSNYNSFDPTFTPQAAWIPPERCGTVSGADRAFNLTRLHGTARPVPCSATGPTICKPATLAFTTDTSYAGRRFGLG
jgi:hypothetical protein